jgi:hypothetical protein
MPEIRFDDIIEITIGGKETRAIIDPRFVEVCEKGTIVCCGSSTDTPHAVGVVIEGSTIVVRASLFPWSRPKVVTLRLSGIRKGFRGRRFGDRTEAQFKANNEFINSAYSGEK